MRRYGLQQKPDRHAHRREPGRFEVKKPIEVTLDVNDGVAYIRYRELRSDEKVAHCERIADTVVLDLDDNAILIGIELLALDDATIEAALGAAHERQLAFPKELARALALA